MTDREKVLHGLSSCGNDYGIPNICEVTECPYGGTGAFCVHNLAHDASMLISELLKAQEPRVMTLEEVQISIDPVWLEGGMAGGTWAMMPFTREYSIEFVADGVCTVYPAFAIGEYGKTWRCWTSRPDQATREATPWQ